jgi:hypothetical protein
MPTGIAPSARAVQTWRGQAPGVRRATFRGAVRWGAVIPAVASTGA